MPPRKKKKKTNGKDEAELSDSLRDFLLAPRWREKLITITIADQAREVLVREPSMEVRDEYLRILDLRYETVDEEDEQDKPDVVVVSDETQELPDEGDGEKRETRIAGDLLGARIALAIGCTYDPNDLDEEGEPRRLFQSSDAERIRSLPSPGWVEEISAIANDFAAEARQAAKNSNAIPKSNSSSGSRKKSRTARSRN